MLIQRLVETGESSKELFECTWEQLLKSIRSVDVLHLLSVLSVYGLTVPLTAEGKQAQSGLDPSIGYPHIELAQALALQLRIEEQSSILASPDKVQEVWNLLIENGDAFWKKRLIEIESATTAEEKAILQLQEQLRNYTHFVRNWGFFSRVIRISRKLYSPLDPFFIKIMGLSASDLIMVFERLVAQTENALADRWAKLRPILKARTVRDAVLAYYNLFPDLEGSPEDLIRVLESKGASPVQARQLIVSHADLRLPDMYTFSSEDLASSIGINAECLQHALDALSYKFGDLSRNDGREFFLANPVWMRPVIRLGDARYFCSMPQLFFSFVFKILDGILRNDEGAYKACIRRRSEFLEDEIATLIQAAFPGCESIRNYKWRQQDTDYETDLLVQIDSYLIIIEAKSGSISWPALRGATARAKRHIQDLIINPAIQSGRLATRLRQMKSDLDNGEDVTQALPFDLISIQKILRLSVTLEEFATIQSNVAVLKTTGWFGDKFEPGATLTLADLEVVFDILSDAPEKLHYLVRRAEFEEHAKYLGHELALLGLYLENGFNIGEAEFREDALNIVMMSRAIDDYYVAQEQGFAPKKPRVKSTKWWRDIRQEIERKHPPRWSEAAVMLLNVSFEEQLELENRFKGVVRTVKRDWRNPRCKNAVGVPCPKWRRDAFVLAAYRESQNERRYELAHNLKDQILADGHVARCLIVGVNIDRKDYPYSFLAVYDSISNV